MHTLHATFDYESIPSAERHPVRHGSGWKDKVRVEWGTNDVVAKRCPKPVRSAYRSLYDAGRIVRYDMKGMIGDGSRFWDQYYVIKDYGDAVIL